MAAANRPRGIPDDWRHPRQWPHGLFVRCNLCGELMRILIHYYSRGQNVIGQAEQVVFLSRSAIQI